MQSWLVETPFPQYHPRQFEYHPSIPNIVLFGTLYGEVVVADIATKRIFSHHDKLTHDSKDSILGICWLNKQNDKFVLGSSKGIIKLCNWQDEEMDGVHDTSFEDFEELTSIHVNCDDSLILVSGYSNSIRIYDIQTGKPLNNFENIHRDHINISRFSNKSPNIFATSSFDKTVKMWDMRVNRNNPVYSCSSTRGHVMLCFSPDDSYLLTSAIDNEIRQYLVGDGSFHMQLQTPKTFFEDNYTRAYYMNDGNVIVSGSSEEQHVNLYCAHSGQILHRAEMYPGRKDPSIYIQSLRGDPHKTNSFSVLVNYRDCAFPLELVHIDMNLDLNGNNVGSLTSTACSSKFSNEILQTLKDGEFADVSLHLMSNDKRLSAHAATLACRCEWFHDILHEKVKEKNLLKKEIIEIEIPSEISSFAMCAVLEFIYSSKLCIGDDYKEKKKSTSEKVSEDDSEYKRELGNVVINVQEASEMLTAASFFKLPRLASLVESHCSTSINIENALEMVEMAINFKANQLVAFCIQFIVYNYSIIQKLFPAECKYVDNNVKSSINNKRITRSMSIDSTMDYEIENEDCIMTDKEEIVSRNSRRSMSVDSIIFKEEGEASKVDFATFDGNVHAYIHKLWEESRVVVGSRPIPENSLRTPRLPSFIPSCIGHTLTLISDSRMIVLGGGNKQQFLSFKNVFLFDVEKLLWSKIDVRGASPASLIYHATSKLHNSPSCNFLVLVGGGNNRAVNTDLVFILDTSLMLWIKPTPSTTVDNSQLTRRSGHTLTSLTLESSGYANLDSITNEFNLIMFGGYTSSTRECHNDVQIVKITRNRNDKNKTPSFSYSFTKCRPQGDAPDHRLAHSATFINFGKEAGQRILYFGGVGYGFIFNALQFINVSNLNSVAWETPSQVEGAFPCARYGHSMVSLTPEKVGLSCNLILFGGQSVHSPCNDVYLLKVTSTNMGIHCQWREVNISGGIPPSPRSRQTAIFTNNKLFVFGGTSDVHSQAGSGGEVEEIDSTLHVLTQVTNIIEEDEEEDFEDLERSNFSWSTPECSYLYLGPWPSLVIPPCSLSRDIYSCMNDSTFADVAFQITELDSSNEGKTVSHRFHAHKSLLINRSQHFRAMLLTCGMRESQEKVIHLDQTQSIVFQLILSYLYSDQATIHGDKIIELVSKSSEYMLSHLTRLCEAVLVQHIDTDSLPFLLSLCDVYNLVFLKEACYSLYLKNKDEVEKSKFWNDLSPSLIKELKERQHNQKHVYHDDHDMKCEIKMNNKKSFV